jgi:hypothetical protein
MINRTIENPGQFILPKERRIGLYTAATLGSVVMSGLVMNSLPSDPKFDIKNNVQQSIPTIEHNDTFEHAGQVLPGEIMQDEIPSLVVEQSTLDFAEKYDVDLKQGQSNVDQQSAQNIEAAVRAVTGGSVQPGTTFETRFDPETGYVVSTYVDDESK